MRIAHSNGLHFYGDTALALEVHGVEHLLAHLPLFYRMGNLQKQVSQSGLPVVYVTDDTKVPNMIHKLKSIFSFLSTSFIYADSSAPNSPIKIFFCKVAIFSTFMKESAFNPLLFDRITKTS